MFSQYLLAVNYLVMKKLVKAAVVAVSIAAPFLAFAENTAGKLSSIESLVGKLTVLIGVIIPFILALATLVILWGLFNYIAGAGDEEKRAQAKQYIIWGIIGLFVMVSIWGLVNVLKGSFNFNNDTIPAPAIPAAGCPPGQVKTFTTSGAVTCTNQQS